MGALVTLKQSFFLSYTLLYLLVVIPFTYTVYHNYYSRPYRLDFDVVDYTSMYDNVALEYFNNDGGIGQSVSADHMLQRDNIFFFSKPVLFTDRFNKDNASWNITSLYAQMANNTLHFFGGVKVVDVGVASLSLHAGSFWYNLDSDDFLADSDVLYQKANQIVKADIAHGNMQTRVVKFQNTKGRIDTRKAG